MMPISGTILHIARRATTHHILEVAIVRLHNEVDELQRGQFVLRGWTQGEGGGGAQGPRR